MSVTIAEARDIMHGVFTAVWTHPALYDDKAGAPPKTGPWARLSVRHARGQQETLPNPLGNRLFRRDGVIIIQIFTPLGNGLALSDQLAKLVMDAYESSSTSVLFRNVQLNEIGPDGNWYQVNVVVEFEYSEAK